MYGFYFWYELNAAEKHSTFSRRHLWEGTLKDTEKDAEEATMVKESSLNVSAQLCHWNEAGLPDTSQGFSTEAISASQPAKRTYHYFSWNLWCGKLTDPRQCLKSGCISASLLWNLLCTLIPPTSSPNTCLWVMSRQGIYPKPAFSLSLSLSLSLPYSFSIRTEDFHQVPILCGSLTCNTGSSVRWETARRLHCKRIMILRGAKGSVPVG